MPKIQKRIQKDAIPAFLDQWPKNKKAYIVLENGQSLLCRELKLKGEDLMANTGLKAPVRIAKSSILEIIVEEETP